MQHLLVIFSSLNSANFATNHAMSVQSHTLSLFVLQDSLLFP
jgi:hypothetical protein